MNPNLQDLLSRAERTFGNQPVEKVVGKTKAIIGVTSLPAGETDAQAALDLLRSGKEPAPKQLAALEVMVRLMRPAPLCKRGELQELPAQNEYNAELVKQWTNFRQQVRSYLASIGRLDPIEGESVGTGFLVDEDLLLTNRHVLEALSFGTNALEPGQAQVKFQQEHGSIDDEPAVSVVSAVGFHPRLDMALLKIKKTSNREPLLIDTDAVRKGDGVVVIGYPFDDSKRNPLYVARIYNGMFGVKRAAPGEVMGVSDQTVFHDCSTLGGNSGSPVLSLNTSRLVGLHASGFFMYRNQAVAAPAVAEFVRQMTT